MSNDIENRVHEIAECIFKAMKNKELEIIDLGLLSGQTGIIVFCAHYLREYPNARKTKILDDYLNLYFDRLTAGVELFTYCSGLAGILEGLRYMNKAELFNVDYSDIENNYAPFLQEFARQNMANMNYDYLHKYFYDDTTFINESLILLEQMAEKDGDIYKWKSRIGMDRTIGYNISLSHGISSIVAVLNQINSRSINREVRDRIITNACNYIISQEIDPQKYGCYFPSTSLDNDPEEVIRQSRMGWCYGDLGVATSLWQAGKLQNNEFWQKKALEVLTYSTTRKDLQNCGIFDSGLCHGSASICMMYHYIYTQTGNILFKDARDYWVNCTLEMGHLAGGLAGYSAWGGEKQGYVNEYGILEGISGIGLVLLTVLSDSDDKVKWMNFFMLN